MNRAPSVHPLLEKGSVKLKDIASYFWIDESFIRTQFPKVGFPERMDVEGRTAFWDSKLVVQFEAEKLSQDRNFFKKMLVASLKGKKKARCDAEARERQEREAKENRINSIDELVNLVKAWFPHIEEQTPNPERELARAMDIVCRNFMTRYQYEEWRNDLDSCEWLEYKPLPHEDGENASA